MNDSQTEFVFDPAKTWAGKQYNHERQLLCGRLSPCGQFAIAGSTDNLLVRWHLETEAKTPFIGHSSWVNSVVFQPAGELVFSCDYGGAIIAWSYKSESPKPAWEVKDAHQGWVRKLAISPNGKTLASCGTNQKICLWNAADGKRLHELTGHEADVFSVEFHPDGKTLLSGDLLGNVKQWDVATGKPLRTINAKPLHTRGDDFLADVGGVRCMAFDASGTKLVCGGMTDADSNTFCPGKPAVLVFDFESGELKQTLRIKDKADGPINALRFLPDGTLVGLGEGAAGAAISFWKIDQVEPFASVKAQSGYDLDLHTDGLRLASTMFQPKGGGGNGRNAKKGEYVPNEGSFTFFHMHDKPKPEKSKKA